MLFDGVLIDDRLVAQLATVLGGSPGRRLQQAVLFRAKLVSLTGEERSAVVAALARAPGQFAEVRELLFADEGWRRDYGRFTSPVLTRDNVR